jgi:prefoldin subunit 5
MQSSQEIQKQISQIQREVKDIENSMSRLSSTQDLIDAHNELNNRQNVIGLLRERLVTSHQKEQSEQAERARLELETKRDTAKDEIEKLNAEFDSLIAPLEALVSEALPQLFEVARARQTQQSRYSELARKLRGGSPDDLGLDRLVSGFGWSARGEQDETKIRRLLYMLYTDFIGGAGGFKDLNRPMPYLARENAPKPQTQQRDTLNSHLHDLGL